MDIMTVSEVIGNVLIIAGALIFASAALGMLRFTDPYLRISAVGTVAGMGVILVVIGAFLCLPTVPDLIKLVLIILVQLGTSAIGTMAIARAAYMTDTPLNPGYFDELKEETDEQSGNR